MILAELESQRFRMDSMRRIKPVVVLCVIELLVVVKRSLNRGGNVDDVCISYMLACT